MSRVVIVGAGISGLAIAFRLQQAIPTCDITILEQAQRPGGAVWTERQDGFQVEFGPNGFLDNKSSTLDLCRDLGLSDRLIPASESAGRNRYLFLNGHLRSLPAGLGALVSSDLLSWRGKLSLLAEFFQPRASLGDESVDSFVRRRMGKEAAEVLADALVTGIYAGDPKLLSLPATFPRLAQWERDYGSVTGGFFVTTRNRWKNKGSSQNLSKGPRRMWSFREGLRLLIESLCSRLRTPPVLGVRVQRIELVQDTSPAGLRWSVLAEGSNRWSASAVVLACPAYQQANLLRRLDQEMSERIEQIPYNRLAVVALGYHQADVPRRLDGFGYIAPQHTGRDILGVQWCSSIFSDRSPQSTVLLRAMCGGWNRPEVAGWEHGRLLEVVRDELRRTLGIMAAPLYHRIIQWDRAIPQYHLGHLERVNWIEKRSTHYPGLILTGNAYRGVALNDCTEQALVVARRVKEVLASVGN
jgi:oxygen-dependent protoporphyrinogen oxidase